MSWSFARGSFPPGLGRVPRVVLAGAVLVVVAAAIFLGIWFLRSSGSAKRGGETAARGHDTLARLTDTCYTPALARYEALRKDAPPTATDGAEFVHGLESLPFLVAALSQRDTRYEDANTKDAAALAQEGKASALQFADLAVEVATCYEQELAGSPLRAAAAELLAELRARRAALDATDFAPFYSTGGPAETALTLAPKEEKTVRVRTLCIDRFAQPPPAGTPYVLSGTVDALMKPELCDLLRGAASGEGSAAAQNAVWRLEQRRATPNTPAVQPVAGATGAYQAQSDRRLAVTAAATGTLTALDVTFTNLSEQPLTIDTSCAVFVPFAVPDVTRTLPTPPPDWSDPATLEKFQRESNEQLLKNLDEYEKIFRQQGRELPPELAEQRRQLREQLSSPAPEVKGVYSQAFIPGSDVNPDELDPFQPIQVGIGPQPLGAVGVVGRPPHRRERPPRPWEVERRDRRVEARERLERALDRLARTPADPGALEDVMEEVRRCELNNCMPTAELERTIETIGRHVQEILNKTIERVIASTQAETLQDAVDALRLCGAVGPSCTATEAARTLDQYIRDYLRQRQQRRGPQQIGE